jgi:anti-sigma B factor antagonist
VLQEAGVRSNFVSSIENPDRVGRQPEHLVVHELDGGGLRLVGEIDMDTSAILRRRLESDLSVTVLDLRDVTFIDSTGLNVLINANRNRGDGLVLRSPTGAVARVLELSGMDRVFRIERPELAAD